MFRRAGLITRTRIGEIRELTRGELVKLRVKRTPHSVVQKFRDSHRKMAWLFASGLRHEEVAEACGYSYVRVVTMANTPAFKELVASLREKVDKARIDSIQDYETLRLANRMKAARQVGDRLDAADDDDGEPLPIRELVSIMGVGEKAHQVNVNVNLDFAARLDRAVARSSKVIEATANPQPPGLAPPGAAHRPDRPDRFAASPALAKSLDEQPQPLQRRRVSA